jgi:hypothetical protein
MMKSLWDFFSAPLRLCGKSIFAALTPNRIALNFPA